MRISTTVAILVALAVAVPSSAAVPRTISYQGVLRQMDGNVVPDGPYDITFRLYDVPSGGSPLWTEAQTLGVADGIFNAILGSVVTLGLPFDGSYWLGVSVAADPELTPRVQLTSAPYALRTAVADSLEGGGSDGDWVISGGDVYRLAGNVGIGTATPGHRLHIYEDTNGPVTISLENPNPSPDSAEAIVFGNEDGELAWIGVYDGEHATFQGAMVIANDRPRGELRFHAGGGEKMRLTSAGKLGIGTVAPSSEVDVAGTVAADDFSAAGTVTTNDLDAAGTVTTNGFEMAGGAGAGYVLTSDASGVGTWQQSSELTLPYEGTVNASSTAFKITNTGTATAGEFVQGNASSASAALRAQHDGDGPAVLGVSNGTDAAGRFMAMNVSSTAPALDVTTLASGPALRASQGAGTAAGEFNGDVDVDGMVDVTGKLVVVASGSDRAAEITTTGSGTCGRFEISNGLNSNPAVYAVSNGNGFAIQAHMTGVGYAGAFSSTHAGSTLPALYVSANGLAEALYVQALGLSDNAATFRGNVIIESKSTGDTVLELGEGLDYAEGFDVYEEATIAPGSVLVIDPDHPGELTLATRPYDSRVAGIVSGGNGLGSGVRLGAGQYEHDVALAGRVYCNVDATDEAVEPGDLLTTSSLPGYAMKAADLGRARGAILGKAMEPLEKGGHGQILVLVALQ